jgi:hypothetical protein
MVPRQRSGDMVAACGSAGSVRCMVYPEADPETWTEIYAPQELSPWFLSYSRAQDLVIPHFLAEGLPWRSYRASEE